MFEYCCSYIVIIYRKVLLNLHNYITHVCLILYTLKLVHMYMLYMYMYVSCFISESVTIQERKTTLFIYMNEVVPYNVIYNYVSCSCYIIQYNKTYYYKKTCFLQFNLIEVS